MICFTFHCPDRPGIVAELSAYLAQHRCNILALEQHVEEQVHRFCLNHESPRGLSLACVEVLVDAVVVHNGHITGFPIIANVVVYFISFTVKDIERRFVHVPMLLAFAAGAVFFKVQMEQLADAIFGFHVMA